MLTAELTRLVMGTPQQGGTFQKTVTATVEPLSDTRKQVRMVSIKADGGNTDTVWIGFSPDVDNTNGFPLDPNESIDIVIDDLSKIYAMSQSGSQKIYIIWVK